MKKIVCFLFGTALFICCMFIYTISAQKKNVETIYTDNAISYGAKYIETNINKEGRFIYKRKVNQKNDYRSKKYNVLRHAGTIYAMRLYEDFANSKTMKEKRILAAKYLLKNYVKKLPDGTYAVISKTDEENLQQRCAKLGGAGLALIGISDLEKEKIVSKEILAGLGNFILNMQKKDGEFYAKYDYDLKKINREHYSLYYPGEAALGLLYLNDAMPDPKWTEGAKKALLYLARKSNSKPNDDIFDHWAMLACAKLINTQTADLKDEELAEIRTFAKQMAKIALKGQNTNILNPYYGAQKGNIRLCSNATYMEGLNAIYQIVEDEHLKAKVKKSLNIGLNFIISAQITQDGETLGGIPNSADYGLKTAPKGASYIRIDNVQHTLSALINYNKLFNNK